MLDPITKDINCFIISNLITLFMNTCCFLWGGGYLNDKLKEEAGSTRSAKPKLAPGAGPHYEFVKPTTWNRPWFSEWQMEVKLTKDYHGPNYFRERPKEMSREQAKPKRTLSAYSECRMGRDAAPTVHLTAGPHPDGALPGSSPLSPAHGPQCEADQGVLRLKQVGRRLPAAEFWGADIPQERRGHPATCRSAVGVHLEQNDAGPKDQQVKKGVGPP